MDLYGCDLWNIRLGSKYIEEMYTTWRIDMRTIRLINGTDLLFKCISYVLTIMLQHGYAPRHFIVSTIVPIPKARNKT